MRQRRGRQHELGCEYHPDHWRRFGYRPRAGRAVPSVMGDVGSKTTCVRGRGSNRATTGGCPYPVCVAICYGTEIRSRDPSHARVGRSLRKGVRYSSRRHPPAHGAAGEGPAAEWLSRRGGTAGLPEAAKANYQGLTPVSVGLFCVAPVGGVYYASFVGGIMVVPPE